jgi:hypothetical protein
MESSKAQSPRPKQHAICSTYPEVTPKMVDDVQKERGYIVVFHASNGERTAFYFKTAEQVNEHCRGRTYKDTEIIDYDELFGVTL